MIWEELQKVLQIAGEALCRIGAPHPCLTFMGRGAIDMFHRVFHQSQSLGLELNDMHRHTKAMAGNYPNICNNLIIAAKSWHCCPCGCYWFLGVCWMRSFSKQAKKWATDVILHGQEPCCWSFSTANGELSILDHAQSINNFEEHAIAASKRWMTQSHIRE